MAVGVQVVTTAPPAGGGTDSTTPATYFLPGLTERGDTTAAVLVRSAAEAADLLGARVTYGTVWDDLQAYFGEAGSDGQAYVARVVGPAASVGTLTLKDRSGGGGVNTLRVDAKDPGAWSSGITVQIVDGIVSNTYDLLVSYAGGTEAFRNLTSPADAVTATAASAYIRVTNLASVTAAPGNNPLVLAATALSAGSDDRASVAAADLVTALARFTPDLGPGAVAIPGQPYSTVGAGLIAHAKANGRIALLATASGQSVSAVSTAARSLRASIGADYAGLFYPWVTVSDGGSGLRTISPEGFIAGRRAATIALRGTYKAPAGALGAAQYVLGLEKSLTAAEVNTLVADAVSPIKLVLGSPRLYDWRSLSLDEANWKFLTARDVLNELASRFNAVLEPFVGETIDGKGHLFTGVANALTNVLTPFADAGGLYARPNGTPPDPGFRVDVGPSVNTPTTIARGEVRAQVNVRVSPVGELIRVTLTKVPLTLNV